MIHVCFGLYDKTRHYSKFTGTTMLSIFENTNSNITVHILHDNTLTADNRDKFIYLAGRYNQLVKFYNVEQLCADELKKIIELVPQAKTSRLSVAALYRLLIPQILSPDIDKIIYLDSDVVLNLDIIELWRIDLADKILGVVAFGTMGRDSKNDPLVSNGLVRAEDYFNSGVLLMNLKILRNELETTRSGLEFLSRNPTFIRLLDQHLLNYCFSNRTLKLPAKFNRTVPWLRKLNEKNIERKIYHYTGGSIKLDLDDPFNRLWLEYFIKTPWFDAGAMERLMEQIYDNARQTHAAFKNGMVTIADAMSGKTRVFLIAEDYLEFITKTFTLRDDEEIIFIEHGAPLQKIADLMKTSRDKKIFFVMFPNFPFEAFVEAGFIYGRDFINVFEFLPNTDGDLLNSYQLIQAM